MEQVISELACYRERRPTAKKPHAKPQRSKHKGTRKTPTPKKKGTAAATQAAAKGGLSAEQIAAAKACGAAAAKSVWTATGGDPVAVGKYLASSAGAAIAARAGNGSGGGAAYDSETVVVSTGKELNPQTHGKEQETNASKKASTPSTAAEAWPALIVNVGKAGSNTSSAAPPVSVRDPFLANVADMLNVLNVESGADEDAQLDSETGGPPHDGDDSDGGSPPLKRQRVLTNDGEIRYQYNSDDASSVHSGGSDGFNNLADVDIRAMNAGRGGGGSSVGSNSPADLVGLPALDITMLDTHTKDLEAAMPVFDVADGRKIGLGLGCSGGGGKEQDGQGGMAPQSTRFAPAPPGAPYNGSIWLALRYIPPPEIGPKEMPLLVQYCRSASFWNAARRHVAPLFSTSDTEATTAAPTTAAATSFPPPPSASSPSIASSSSARPAVDPVRAQHGTAATAEASTPSHPPTSSSPPPQPSTASTPTLLPKVMWNPLTIKVAFEENSNSQHEGAMMPRTLSPCSLLFATFLAFSCFLAPCMVLAAISRVCIPISAPYTCHLLLSSVSVS